MDLVFGRAAVLAAIATLVGGAALAHGFAGDRFFPATLQTDDPFVADEMSLLTVTKNPDDPTGGQSYSFEFDIAKRVTRDFGLTAAYEWNYFQPKGMPSTHGFGSLTTGAQYQLFIDAPHEMMALAGLDVSWAHTGAVQSGGADDHTTLEPTFDFGKGFGDLPPWLPWLRPFAVTGNLSIDLPTRVNSAGMLNQNMFNAGFAIEYSLEFLQHHVRDVRASGALRSPYPAGRDHVGDAAQSRPRSGRARHGDDQQFRPCHHRHRRAGTDLGGTIFPDRRRGDHPLWRGAGPRHRGARPASSLSRRSVPQLDRPPPS